MALCFLNNGIVHSVVAHLLLLKFAKSKQTSGGKKSLPIILWSPVLSLGTLLGIGCGPIGRDSSFISVQCDGCANRWTPKHLDLSLMRKQVTSARLPSPILRNVRDTSDGHRCGWPHLWQQCSSGVQYPPWPAILFCRPQNRWENTRIYHFYFSLETKLWSNVETFWCNIWEDLNGSVMLGDASDAFLKCPTQLHQRNYILILHFTALRDSAFLL